MFIFILMKMPWSGGLNNNDNYWWKPYLNPVDVTEYMHVALLTNWLLGLQLNWNWSVFNAKSIIYDYSANIIVSIQHWNT